MISPALCRKGGALRHEAGIPGAAAEAAGAKRYNAKDAGGVLGTFPGINRHEARARVRVCARTLERVGICAYVSGVLLYHAREERGMSVSCGNG